MVDMLTVQLARDLAAAGVLWQPRAGDRFIIDAELLTGEVFWISDLTVEVYHYEGQSLLGFNGHLYVAGGVLDPENRPGVVKRVLEVPNVLAATPVIESQAMAVGPTSIDSSSSRPRSFTAKRTRVFL